MKKFFTLCLLISILISVCFISAKPKNKARAESYAIVISDDCKLFWDQSLKTVKFYLPKSYFVKIISYGAEYCKVSYLDDSLSYPETSGYVKNQDLDFSLLPDDIIYPNLTLTLKNDDVLFLDAEKTQPKSVIKSKATAVFYGEITIDNEIYVYCYTDGLIGYIRKSSFEDFTIPLNPKIEELFEPDSSLSSQDTSSSEVISEENAPKPKYVSYIIFGIAIIVVLIILYAILHPEKNKSNDSFFSNDDF